MDLADLAIFKAVADEGGIVRAARKLHRVPSSVTSRIQQLEGSVDSQLFVRSKQRLHLSPSGKVLLAYAERLLNLASEARAAVADGPPRGVLKLGALESTTASRLPAVFSAFHRSNAAGHGECGVDLLEDRCKSIQVMAHQSQPSYRSEVIVKLPNNEWTHREDSDHSNCNNRINASDRLASMQRRRTAAHRQHPQGEPLSLVGSRIQDFNSRSVLLLVPAAEIGPFEHLPKSLQLVIGYGAFR